MKKIVIANWKMNPQTLEEAEDLFRLSSGAIVCPPFVYIEELSKIKSGAVLGAQDIAFSEEPGQPGSRSSDSGVAAKDNKSELSLPGQTGEISGEMLKRFGVKYVIIGHSERRWPRSRSSDSGFAATEQSELALRGESDAVVNAKIKIALAHELTPIVCIGERSREGDFESFLKNQVRATFAGLLSSEQAERCLVAYEPVWAISTAPGAKPDRPESALESIGIIKQALSSDLPFLYGGSVTSANVRGFLFLREISGVLVGEASLDKEEFQKILRIASNV